MGEPIRFRNCPTMLTRAPPYDVKAIEKRKLVAGKENNFVWTTHRIQTNSSEHPCMGEFMCAMMRCSLQRKCSYMCGQGAQSFWQWDFHMPPSEMRSGELQWSAGNYALEGNATVPDSNHPFFSCPDMDAFMLVLYKWNSKCGKGTELMGCSIRNLHPRLWAK